MRLDSNLTFVDMQPVYRKISIDAIKNHPGIYAKFFICNFIIFFSNIKLVTEYYGLMENIYTRSVVNEKYIHELESGRWMNISSDKSDFEKVKLFFETEVEKQKNLKYINVNQDGKVEIKQTFLKSIFQLYERISDIIFRNIIWLFVYAFIFIISAYRLYKSKLKDMDAFISFLFCVIFISNAVLVSMVGVSLLRYSYTVEFVFYFSLPFMIILLKNLRTLNRLKSNL